MTSACSISIAPGWGGVLDISTAPAASVEIQAAPAAVIEVAVAVIGQKGDKGEKGERGEPGKNATSFEHVQSNPEAVWTVVHNQGRFPSVTVVDSAHDTVFGDVAYLDANRITLTFAVPFSGTAYLN